MSSNLMCSFVPESGSSRTTGMSRSLRSEDPKATAVSLKSCRSIVLYFIHYCSLNTFTYLDTEEEKAAMRNDHGILVKQTKTVENQLMMVCFYNSRHI